MEYVLETNELFKRYRNEYALRGIDMHVPKGSVYGFVGQNGAGKTTLIRVVAGLHPETAGSYTLFGVDCRDKNICKARARLGAIAEKPSFYGSLSARENLKAVNLMRGNPTEKQLADLLEYVGLARIGNKKVKEMSLGMRQRLGIAMALVGNPDFLMLDEPINGLDPSGIIEIRELILRLNREQGVTVLLSSHILGELSKIATCYGFISGGKMLQEIDAEALERKFRTKTLITVSETARLAPVFDRHGISYAINSPTEAEIYTDVPAGRLSELIAEEAGAMLMTCNRSEEDLETYYANLLGEGGNA